VTEGVAAGRLQDARFLDSSLNRALQDLFVLVMTGW
jgi:hypothetical protein